MFLESLKGFDLMLLPLVAAGIILRIRRKEWTPAETLLVCLWLGHALFVLAQVLAFGGDFTKRYLLTGAPLSFGWAGYALQRLFRKPLAARFIPLLVILLFLSGLRPVVKRFKKRSSEEQPAFIAAMTKIIRDDWGNQPREDAPPLSCHQYRSPFRPRIHCESSDILGYAAGGSVFNPKHIGGGLHADYQIFINEPVSPAFTQIGEQVISGRHYRVGRRLP